MKVFLNLVGMLLAANAVADYRWLPGQFTGGEDGVPDESFFDFRVEADGTIVAIGEEYDFVESADWFGEYFWDGVSWARETRYSFDGDGSVYLRRYRGPNEVVAELHYSWNPELNAFGTCHGALFFDALLYGADINWSYSRTGVTQFRDIDGYVIQDANQNTAVGFMTDVCDEVVQSFIWDRGEEHFMLLPRQKTEQNVVIAPSISESGIIVGGMYKGHSFDEFRTFFFSSAVPALWKPPYKDSPMILPYEQSAESWAYATAISCDSMWIAGFTSGDSFLEGRMVRWHFVDGGWNKETLNIDSSVASSLSPSNILPDGTILGSRSLNARDTEGFAVSKDGKLLTGQEYLERVGLHLSKIYNFERVRSLGGESVGILIDAVPNGLLIADLSSFVDAPRLEYQATPEMLTLRWSNRYPQYQLKQSTGLSGQWTSIDGLEVFEEASRYRVDIPISTESDRLFKLVTQ